MSAERAGGQEGNQRRRDLSADARRARTQQRANIANNAVAMPAADINNKNQNPNIVVRASELDSYVPTICRVNESDIKAKFPHQHLTSIEGKPTYNTVQNLSRERARRQCAHSQGQIWRKEERKPRSCLRKCKIPHRIRRNGLGM